MAQKLYFFFIFCLSFLYVYFIFPLGKLDSTWGNWSAHLRPGSRREIAATGL
jgi:hypothetical protein